MKKIDILIRHENTNIFIAECKIWRGIKSYCAAIDQLLSYLTWRDTKTALKIFVDNKEIIPVLEQIKTKTKNHKKYIKEHAPSTKSWFNYTFHLNDDENCEIQLAVLIFYFSLQIKGEKMDTTMISILSNILLTIVTGIMAYATYKMANSTRESVNEMKLTR